MSDQFPNLSPKARAALLVAEDDLTDETIAATIGITRRTLTNWKRNPEFAALVGDHIGQLNAGMLKLAVAKKRKRLEILDDLHTRQLQVITQRAERYALEADTAAAAAKRVLGTHTPPEAATGLLVREETINANGGSTVKWSFDAALTKEIRATQEQAAKELGQWVDKTEIGGTVSVVRIVGANVENI